MFSWPSLYERMCRTWGSNSGPLACQANSLPIELPRLSDLILIMSSLWEETLACQFQKRQKRYPCLVNVFYRCKMSRLMTKPTKWHVRPARTPISLGNKPSLIRIFAVRMKKAWVLSYQSSAQSKLWSDWADAQVDLSLRWVHSHFVGFNMRRLKCW